MIKEVSLTLNQQDLAIISEALVQLPYRVAAPLINKINEQISENLAERQDSDQGNQAGE